MVMSSTSAPSEPPRSDSRVRTAVADDLRAVVQVSGDLDAAGATALEALLEEHCSAGRRFVRVNLFGVHQLSTRLVTLLERTHYRMLARRGTAILTGAGPDVIWQLRELGLDSVLFVVETSADEESAIGTGATRSSWEVAPF
jgi:anti-anti-sigma regulatory factor